MKNTTLNSRLPRRDLSADLCVVGGGMAGICASIAAARCGIKVILIQDRPVLGGNASSEIRMWISGAVGKNRLETGIIEEIRLENMYRNRACSYALWDMVLYDKVRNQPNLTLLMNSSCLDADLEGDTISSVVAWQMTTQTFIRVNASLFADCSGDSILAALSGARTRTGRESSSEYNESIAPDKSDAAVMGMSCLIQAREHESPQPYFPPDWAYVYETDEALPYRNHKLNKSNNFWWLQLGGECDPIADTETTKDELLKIAFGVWDHIKNRGDHGAENWQLEWVGFLPGKRESRRYVGPHVLTQNDITKGGLFEDAVAYGGWPMDDHHPGGLNWKGKPTTFHRAPSPYGIPLRCLYSVNIRNLMMAGRNISVTHSALSSTRVMATCSLLGQAVGVASAISLKNETLPHSLSPSKVRQIQDELRDQDVWIPGTERKIPELTQRARARCGDGDWALLNNGHDRPIDLDSKKTSLDQDADPAVSETESQKSQERPNCWISELPAWIEFSWQQPVAIKGFRFVFDSDLNRKTMGTRQALNMPCIRPLEGWRQGPPETLVKSLQIEVLDDAGDWQQAGELRSNYQRLVKIGCPVTASRVRVTFTETWGADTCRLFGCEVF